MTEPRKPKPLRENDKSFIQGLALAAAYMIRTRDEPVFGLEIITEHGFTIKDLKEANVDPFDLDAIKAAMKEAKLK